MEALNASLGQVGATFLESQSPQRAMCGGILCAAGAYGAPDMRGVRPALYAPFNMGLSAHHHGCSCRLALPALHR